MTHLIKYVCGFCICLALACSAHLRAQGPPNAPTYDPSQINQRFPNKTVSVDHQEDTPEQLHQMRIFNAARQKSLVTDADKLLTLALALNADVATGTNRLTPAQRMKMAADIEKLAHNVKEKMSYTTQGMGAQQNPFHSWQ